MDDDYDDYSYYRKPKMSLAAGPAHVDDDGDEGEPTQAWKAVYCSFGVACIALGLCTSGMFQFALFWVALAFVVGPFSPLKVTGGNCVVGLGGEVELEQDNVEAEESAALLPARGSSSKDRNGPGPAVLGSKVLESAAKSPAVLEPSKGDWSKADWDQLRKLLVKFPRGTPQRWEAVARGLSTKRSTEEVIAASKFMAESTVKDPYAAFVSQRQGQAPAKGSTVTESPQPASSRQPTEEWTDAQDRALLEALKKFPKDDPARWDKVASAVGSSKSRADCMKRLTDLKSSLKAKKASNELLTLNSEGNPVTELL